MEYGLTQNVRSSSLFIKISEEEYKSIKYAENNLLELALIEEKFDLASENYIEFEMCLLECTVHNMLQGGHDHKWFNGQRRLFNRRLLNFLSTARAYIDHVPQHFHHIVPPIKDKPCPVQALFREQYDAHLGYRAMEALRNYAQHAGDPVHAGSYGAHWVNERSHNRYTVNLYLEPATLRAQGSFKAEILTELEAVGERIDLKLMVREYMEGLWNAHDAIRNLLKEGASMWRRRINGAIKKYKSESSQEQSIVGLAAVIKDEDGSYSGVINLQGDFIDYIGLLTRKNSSFVDLSSRYATSEICNDG